MKEITSYNFMKLSEVHKAYLDVYIDDTILEQYLQKKHKNLASQITTFIETIIPDNVTFPATHNSATDLMQLWLLLDISIFGYISYMVTSEEHDSFMFSVLCRSIANSIYSTMLLAKNGLDHAAQTSLRTLMEQFFILLSVTHDSEKRKAYRDNYEGIAANTSWYKNFKKDKFIKMINEYYDNVNFPLTTIKKLFTDFIESEYSDYSSCVHNDYAYVMGYSMAEVSENCIKPNFCGEYVTREYTINANCFNLSLIMTNIFFHMMVVQCPDWDLKKLLGIETQSTNESIQTFYYLQRYFGFLILKRIVKESL